MNRRKAIYRLLLLGGAATGAYAGYKGFHLLKRPDLERLAKYQLLIDELADTILPATDSPGARAAGVGSFITKMVRDCSGRRSQNNFIEGLDGVTAYAVDHFDMPFEKCTREEKNKILAHYEKKGTRHTGVRGKAEHYLFGDSFFETLRKYTVMGYCTSRQGATEGLSYDYIPGKYNGCVKLLPGQRAWATQ